ncbi:MAG: polyprenyl synthetase family protein [Candidatus Marsarchaeota archaeon]|nr:polyprenyl synthetase family protein [Candidatus Marsarchaeota archaeon]
MNDERSARIETALKTKDFKEFIKAYSDDVYSKECEYMPNGIPDEFNEVVRSYVDRRGQYRRPGYLLIWTALYGGNMDGAILPAAIQQLSEDYFLMHDDLMDSNEVRRGKPSAQMLYDPAYVIDAGDTLHNILWRMVHDASTMLGAEKGKRYFDRIYDIMYTTHIGQYYDLSLAREPDITKFTREDYFKSIYAKAGYYSVAGPMQCGAIIGGTSEEELSKMPEYGVPAGNAFQITDDILDCISTVGELGKSIGNDVREGAKTLILWHAVHNAPTTTLNRMKSIYKLPRKQKSKEDVEWVLNTFNELGSIKYAQAEALRLCDEAVEKFKKLSTNIPDSPIKEIALSSIAHTAKRSK